MATLYPRINACERLHRRGRCRILSSSTPCALSALSFPGYKLDMRDFPGVHGWVEGTDLPRCPLHGYKVFVGTLGLLLITIIIFQQRRRRKRLIYICTLRSSWQQEDPPSPPPEDRRERPAALSGRTYPCGPRGRCQEDAPNELKWRFYTSSRALCAASAPVITPRSAAVSSMTAPLSPLPLLLPSSRLSLPCKSSAPQPINAPQTYDLQPLLT